MFVRNRLVQLAGQDAPGGGGTPPNAGVGAGTVDVNELVNQVVGKRVKKEIARAMEGLRGDLMSVVKEAMGQKPADATDPATRAAQEPAANNGGESAERLTMKALQSQLEELRNGIKERDRKVSEAESKARDIRVRSEVQSHFARHMGADSPHLAPYVNHFLSQFMDQDGSVGRKIKNEYGEDVFVPAGQAVDEMFKSDLKHLAPRTQGLPQAKPFGLRGNQVQSPMDAVNNGNAPTKQIPSFLGTIANHMAAHGDVDTANALINSITSKTDSQK